MDNWKTYQRAANIVNAKIVFYFHLAAYIMVNIFLIIVNFRITPRAMWFHWPLLGWGIGLFFHALSLFVIYGNMGIKEKMVEKEMKKGGTA